MIKVITKENKMNDNITIKGSDKVTQMVMIRNDKGIVIATVYVSGDSKTVYVDTLAVLDTDQQCTLHNKEVANA
tara:strand:- start:911 stop:1132 length:222 start_codon:yes stop_codon:yes gene_type:complete